MPSSNNSKTYAPSVTSTSSSASFAKPKSTKSSSKRSTAILQSAKKLLSDLGSPPTASYDREHQRDTEKLYVPNQAPRRT